MSNSEAISRATRFSSGVTFVADFNVRRAAGPEIEIAVKVGEGTDAATLAVVYRYFTQVAQLQETLDAVMAAPVTPTEVPENLQAQIRALITDDTTLSWDAALWAVVRDRTDEEGG